MRKPAIENKFSVGDRIRPTKVAVGKHGEWLDQEWVIIEMNPIVYRSVKNRWVKFLSGTVKLQSTDELKIETRFLDEDCFELVVTNHLTNTTN